MLGERGDERLDGPAQQLLSINAGLVDVVLDLSPGPLHELVPPEHGTGLGGIEEAADVSQGLRLIHARQDRRDVGIRNGITAIFGKWRNAIFPCGGMV